MLFLLSIIGKSLAQAPTKIVQGKIATKMQNKWPVIGAVDKITAFKPSNHNIVLKV